MSEEAILEQGTEGVQEESAVTENTDIKGTQGSVEAGKEDNLEGQAIPYKRFKEVNTRMKEAEAKAKMFEGKDYLLNLEQMIASDPEKEEAIIKILTEGKQKKEKDPTENIIEQKIKSYADTATATQIKENLAAYNDDFDQLIGNVDESEKELMTALVDIKLNTKYKGWKNIYRPGIVEKALKDVQGDLNKLFNGQKKEYINGKLSDTNPEIGKGVKGSKTERIPIEDETAFQEHVARAMNGG